MDAMLLRAGLVHKDRAGDQEKGRMLDTLKDEKERGITIKSTAITLDLKAHWRAVRYGPAGKALTEALESRKKPAEYVELYLGKLPPSVDSPEKLQSALQHQVGLLDISRIHVSKRRNYASVSLDEKLAAELLCLGHVEVHGRSVSIEKMEESSMSRLKHLCENNGLAMPDIGVRRMEQRSCDSALYVGLASWTALGGVLIQSESSYSSIAKARHAVAEDCLEFLDKYVKGIDAGANKAVLTQDTALSVEESDSLRIPADGSIQDRRREAHGDSIPIKISLIDCPGHVDFNAEVTSALRLCDGALVVVDAVEGKAVQTDSVLIQALREGVRPVLMINKVDRLIIDKQLSPEMIYDALMSVVSQVNNFIRHYQLTCFPDQSVSFLHGSVCFGSGYFGWSCAVDSFVPRNCSIEEYRLYQEALSQKEGFVNRILRPLVRLHRLCGVIPSRKSLVPSERLRIISDILQDKGISVRKATTEDLQQPRAFLKKVLMSWLPAAVALTDMIAAHVPSPLTIQTLRAPLLYTGDLADPTGIGMTRCDASGPTLIYVSKMVQSPTAKKTRCAYGRVFSGTVRVGDCLNVICPNEVSRSASVTQIIQFGLSGRMHSVDMAVAGELVALTGLEKVLNKSGTLCSDKSASHIKEMQFAVTPSVKHSIYPRDKKQLVKMVDTMSRIVDSDPAAQFYKDCESGEYLLAGAGELHIEVLVSALVQESGIDVTVSEPIVSYRETVKFESSYVALAKSDNGHNRLWFRASVLPQDVVDVIKSNDSKDLKALGKKLMADCGWNASQASRLWACGPETSTAQSGTSDFDRPSCVLVDSTFGLQLPDDARSSIVSAFMQTVRQGPLVGSPMYGVRFDLVDAKFHQDAVHRRPNSVVPAASRAMRGAFLYADACLLEPIFRATVTGASGKIHSAFSVLSSRGAEITNTQIGEADDLVEAMIPIRRSFGLADELRGATQGYAQCSLLLDGIRLVPPDHHEEILAAARQQKNFPARLPVPEDFVDRL